jgi:hypothetical protein
MKNLPFAFSEIQVYLELYFTGSSEIFLWFSPNWPDLAKLLDRPTPRCRRIVSKELTHLHKIPRQQRQTHSDTTRHD